MSEALRKPECAVKAEDYTWGKEGKKAVVLKYPYVGENTGEGTVAIFDDADAAFDLAARIDMVQTSTETVGPLDWVLETLYVNPTATAAEFVKEQNIMWIVY